MTTLYLVTLAAFCIIVLCALICADVSVCPRHHGNWAAKPPRVVANSWRYVEATCQPPPNARISPTVA